MSYTRTYFEHERQCITEIMEQILREIHLLKLNQSRILNYLQLEENPMTSSPMPTPTPTPMTMTTPTTATTTTPTTITAMETPTSDELSIQEETFSSPPATEKRRKTISKRYSNDEQKLLLYGGHKIHVQVNTIMITTTMMTTTTMTTTTMTMMMMMKTTLN